MYQTFKGRVVTHWRHRWRVSPYLRWRTNHILPKGCFSHLNWWWRILRRQLQPRASDRCSVGGSRRFYCLGCTQKWGPILFCVKKKSGSNLFGAVQSFYFGVQKKSGSNFLGRYHLFYFGRVQKMGSIFYFGDHIFFGGPIFILGSKKLGVQFYLFLGSKKNWVHFI